jgi:two-component system sensor histidine kinase/response regulator
MQGNKVLIIEDTESLAAAIKCELQETFQIKADIASTLAQAKILLNKNPEEYFISTVDLQLPDCNDGAAIDLVNEHNVPAIVFTGQQDPTVRAHFDTHDLVDYVFKTGGYSIIYICRLINRVYFNQDFTILVVDDSRSALLSIKKLLSNQGFKVLCAKDANECMISMKHEPDMVILDQFLPDGLGHDICRQIRTLHLNSNLQIIGVSSKGDKDAAAFFLKNGGDDFLLRPFNPEEFIHRINQRADYVDQIRELKKISDEKNHFLGMAAHDLRNPLSIIQQASKRLNKPNLSEDQIHSLLEMIKKSGMGMQQLLDDLLDISAIESGKIDLHKLPLNLTEILKERMAAFQSKAHTKNIELLESFPESAMVELDPTRITQVIDNLLSNAIKYSPKNLQITLSLEKELDVLRVNVIDQGPGIKKEDVGKLFKPFNRLGHRTTGGESSHGLGLSICLRIVEAHMGSIGYKDAPDAGSHFYFELPK